MTEPILSDKMPPQARFVTQTEWMDAQRQAILRFCEAVDERANTIWPTFSRVGINWDACRDQAFKDVRDELQLDNTKT